MKATSFCLNSHHTRSSSVTNARSRRINVPPAVRDTLPASAAKIWSPAPHTHNHGVCHARNGFNHHRFIATVSLISTSQHEQRPAET